MKLTLKNPILLISIMLFILLDSYFLFSIFSAKRYKSELLSKKFQDSISMQIKIEDFKNKYNYSISSDLVTVNNIHLETSNENHLLLKNVLNKNKIVLRFTSGCCMMCVVYTINLLNELSKFVGVENIILIGDFEKARYLEIFKQQNNIKFNCYNSNENLGIAFENNSIFPHVEYILIIDKNLKTHFPHIISSQDSLSSMYYKRIIKEFNTNIK